MIHLVFNQIRSDRSLVATRWATQLDMQKPGSVLTSVGSPPVGLGKGDWVVFFDLPAAGVLERLRKAHARSLLVFSWDHLVDPRRMGLTEIDTVICPSRCSYRHLDAANLEINDLILMPWDLCVDPSRSDPVVDDDRIGVLWSLDGSQADLSGSFLPSIVSLFSLPFFYLTILYGDHLSAALKSRLDDLRFRSSGRIETVRCPSLDQQLELAVVHDLILWPSHRDDFGLPGLLAATAGIPCIAYDHTVPAELIRNDRNGVLVPCELTFDVAGAPTAVVDHDRFLLETKLLLQNPDRLYQLRNKTNSRLRDRRESFEAVSDELFGLG